ncbi:MAG: lysine--tRNA ligase [Candidatus Kaiserbacteria bacterium]|nr:lysine--tRNA ligase [Candidatus Kaiserbacteria bacterium]
MVRISDKDYGQEGRYWADGIADYLIQKDPERTTFVCASGISPSGPVHFGNLREVITTYAVAEALERRGKKTSFIYSWDDFDRFRKIPSGLPNTYEEHIGKPLSALPSPTNSNQSYAAFYEQGFESALQSLNIRPTYRYQTQEYQSGSYDQAIIEALQKREQIADIMLSFMTEKGKKQKQIDDKTYRDTYYPITIYSRFSGKDTTTILSYDGEKTIRYRCNSTKKEDEVDITKHRVVKLKWKVDWAMRWRHEGVCFEPGGSDHAAPGSSYDTAAAIAKQVFHINPPLFIEYGFVGLQGIGTKMSGSSGQTVSPHDLLTIYEPSTLLLMYLRRLPTQTFSLAFDTEVYRQYDERDSLSPPSFWHRIRSLFMQQEGSIDRRIIAILQTLYPDERYVNPVPFRQLVGFAQTVQWDTSKLTDLFNTLHLNYDTTSISSRLNRAKTWVTTYNKDAALVIREQQNTDHWDEMDEENKGYIRNICSYITEHGTDDITVLEEYLYTLPKEQHTEERSLKKAQRTLFGHVYLLLLGQKTGPRLSTLLWSLPQKKILSLLRFS